MAYDVFISYRRQGGGADARMMYDRLANAGYTVSFDMDTLKNGNFNEELLKRVAECKNFVVLLSEGCFDRTLEGCKRENDWLRIEIATALYNNKNIVTVMLPGFSFPEKLPPDIDAIRNKNGPKYDLYYIDGFYDKLQKDFLVKEVSAESTSVSKLEEVFSQPEIKNDDAGDILDVLGDDTDFVRQEALQKYSVLSRLLPYGELENLDRTWEDAEKKKSEHAYKEAGDLYLKVMKLCADATPCSSAFVMRMTADEIDTRKRDWFCKALARAQSGDVDYEYGVGCIYAGGLGVAKNEASAFRWFDRSARAGNLSAMAAVGAAYSMGCGVETDYDAAVEWLTKAANEGLPLAEERLGYLYQNGLGVSKDLNVAREWYEKSAALGNSSARAALGSMYMAGCGVKKNEECAMAWFRQAAADDHPVALSTLAETLFATNDASKFEEALSYCRRAVNAGDADAVCILGKAYELGRGVEKDLKKAGELYQKAKTLGSMRAETCLKEMEPNTQYALGLKYMEGRGVSQDFVRARYWLERAAEQGYTEAMSWYGHLLSSGLGGTVDMTSAIKYFEKAAESGSAVALVQLGGLYKSGTVFKEDKRKALQYYEKAAHLWNDVPAESRWFAVGAFTRMALMYKRGDSCSKDAFLAARLYRFAATSGSIPACKNLAVMYRDGIGVTKSQ